MEFQNRSVNPLLNSGISSGKTSNFESDNSMSSPTKNSNHMSIKSTDRPLRMKYKDWGRKNTNTNKTTNTGGTTSNNSYQSDRESPIRVNIFNGEEIRKRNKKRRRESVRGVGKMLAGLTDFVKNPKLAKRNSEKLAVPDNDWTINVAPVNSVSPLQPFFTSEFNFQNLLMNWRELFCKMC